MQSRTGHILQPSHENIEFLARELRDGRLVAIPTETVYGLAGHLFDETALTQIFSAKERPTFDPLIAHIASPDQKFTIQTLSEAGLIDEAKIEWATRKSIELLMATFWPGPLTLILPKMKGVPDLATSGLASVAIRAPRHPVAQAVLLEAKIPLAAPSANRFGRISPTQAEHVFKELGDRIPWILDGGPCEIGLESTIIGIENNQWTLFRPGGIPREDLEALTGSSFNMPAAQNPSAPSAPGMLSSHYAPKKPLYLLASPVSSLLALPDPVLEMSTLGVLIYSGDSVKASLELSQKFGRRILCQSLSTQGDSNEAAQNLFSALRTLDESEAQAILAEPCPDPAQGLGHAIADRLRRASSNAWYSIGQD